MTMTALSNTLPPTGIRPTSAGLANLFRICASENRVRNSFRYNTYEKHTGGEGGTEFSIPQPNLKPLTSTP